MTPPVPATEGCRILPLYPRRRPVPERDTAGWRSIAAEMWPAWQELNRWEEDVARDLGDELGELIVLLWGVHRFAGVAPGAVMVNEMIDGELLDELVTPLHYDIVETAFALGAAWAEARREGR